MTDFAVGSWGCFYGNMSLILSGRCGIIKKQKRNSGGRFMKILVIGGTRYFGVHMVNSLLKKGYDVTIATRGKTADNFGNKVKRIVFDRSDKDSIMTLGNSHYDVVIDKIAYSSNDIKNVLDILDYDRYIYMSSTAVYEEKTLNTKECDYNGVNQKLIWCDRSDFSYGEVKRQAENALYQKYAEKNWTAVRYPVVLGKDDYTNRLLFYVEHILNSIPMNIDNLDNQMSFIRSDEAGEFLSFIVDKKFKGVINGCSGGTVALREIIKFIEEKTNTKAIISSDGDDAPYNGECSHCINTEKAEALGFKFSNIKDWIFELLEHYITQLKSE